MQHLCHRSEAHMARVLLCDGQQGVLRCLCWCRIRLHRRAASSLKLERMKL